jgi:hypothetical protein
MTTPDQISLDAELDATLANIRDLESIETFSPPPLCEIFAAIDRIRPAIMDEIDRSVSHDAAPRRRPHLIVIPGGRNG